MPRQRVARIALAVNASLAAWRSLDGAGPDAAAVTRYRQVAAQPLSVARARRWASTDPANENGSG